MATTVELGGRTYELRYGFRELREAERGIDKPLLSVIVAQRSMFTIDQLVLLLWPVLRRQHAGLTIRKLEDAIEAFVAEQSVTALNAPVVEALLASGLLVRPEPTPDGDAAPAPARPSTPADSSVS